MRNILVVGGTGAQGAAVVRSLASASQYRILLFTRDPNTPKCRALTKIGDVEAIANHAAHGYDLAAFEEAARKSDGVFINTDGFALGEPAETYWGIRLYESALKAGVGHIVYSGLDDNLRNSNYSPEYYVGHYQGKARVQSYIHGQPRSKTAWTIIRSGPYMEMLSEFLNPQVDAKGNYSFQIPLENGAVPFIYLEDFGRYVRWIFENANESAGLDIGLATAHITGQDIADAFSATTGKTTEYRSIPAAAWCRAAFSKLPDGADSKVGYRSTSDHSTLNQSYAENFENWWSLYKASGDNAGLIRRDYGYLDKILPDRVRSVREWMELTGYIGERVELLDRGLSS